MTPDRFQYFRVEARDILDQLGQATLDLEKDVPGPDSVARLLRLAHTLKGAARVVKERGIADRAHALEDALTPIRDVARPVARVEVDRMLLLIDEMNGQVAQLAPQPAGRETLHTDQPNQSLLVFRPAMEDLEVLLGGVFETRVGLGALRARLAELDRGRHVAALMADQLGRPRGAARTGGSILDREIRPMAEDLRDMFRTLDREWTLNIDHLDRELREVHEAAERLRLAPVRALFMFLERAVRDVATDLGKRVVFDAHGGDVRIDRSVLSVIQGALLHIVRNAAVHGIEADNERVAAGKPADGRVTLRVFQHGRSVSFACTDDGRGVDLDAVRHMARRRGIEEGRSMEPEELLCLLLKGGMTTSGVVTGVSGRGIGLDVVREAAERLGGEVTARTLAGSGTTVELIVPLSIAAFSALIVDGFDGTVAIPLDAVRLTMRIRREEIVQTGQHESVLFNGQAIPVVSLRQLASSPSSSPRSAAYASVVVVQGRTGVAAFSVDRILGTREVVMRRLPDGVQARKIVAGATFDPAGDPQLVLDPDSLVAAGQHERVPVPASAPAPVSILVVDDSLTTRMLEASILESAGYTVHLATSGEEALDMARSTRYALFLVDVELPGMDGFTFIERTRIDPSLQRIPSILVTSRDAPEDRQRGRDVGARGYIVKSHFDQGALIEQIRGLLGQ